MNNEEKVYMKGFLSIFVYENGILKSNHHHNNLVVNGGRTAMAALVSGAGGTDKYITQIGFGTGTSDAALTDDDLTGIFKKALGATSYPQTGAVSFAFVLDYAENNGVDITEFGLLCDDDTLFSRKVREKITKTSSIRLEGIWTIQF